jgi:hypothetical protein
MTKDKKLENLINQWLRLYAQARQDGLPAGELNEINWQLIDALPAGVRTLVLERFRGGA